MNYIYTFITALTISIIITPLIIHIAKKRKLFDTYSERKIHKKAIPRIGGISIFLSIIIATVMFGNPSEYIAFIICISSIFVLGLIDDLKDLSAQTKFLWQLAIAIFYILYTDTYITSLNTLLPAIRIELNTLSIPFTVIFLVAIMNAINLTDGLDGLASGISLISMIFLLYFSIIMKDTFLPIILIAAVASILGFLRYNTYPAKVFMGDSGSVLLGFVLGVSLIRFTSNIHDFPFYTAIMLISIPIFDTIHVMYRRQQQNKSITTADRNHFHYQLMDIGFSHPESVKIIFLLTMISCAIGAMPFIFPAQYIWFLWPVGILFICLCIFITHKLPKDYFFRFREKARKKQYQLAIYKKNKQLTITYIINSLLKYTLITLFILPSFFTSHLPQFMGIISLIAATILLITLFIDQNKMHDYLIFITLCCCLILLIDNNYYRFILKVMSTTYDITWIYNILFVIVLILAGIKFLYDIRARYFKTSILDFFIFMLPLLITIMPSNFIDQFHLKSVSMKFMIIFFAIKVLVIRKSKHNRRVILSVVIGLAIAAILAGFKVTIV